MKAGIYYGKGDIRYEDVEIPVIKDGEILIKTEACGLCGTDIHKALDSTVKGPVVLGHEAVGRVVEKGKGVERFNIGDRIITAIHVPCFTCHYCNKGQYTLCAQFKNTNIEPGGFAEYIRIPEEHVKHLVQIVPENISIEEATLAEPVACCIHGLKAADIKPGDSVMVMGAGQIGSIHGQLAKLKGADKVIITDISEFKLRKAKELGVDFTVNVLKENLSERIEEITGGNGVDIAIIAAGNSSLLSEAVRLLRRGGKIIVFSPFDKDNMVKIDAGRFFRDEISIIGTYSVTPYDFPEAMDIIEKGKINIKSMITHTFPLEKLKEAVELAADPEKESLKIIITT
jgi:L-iditol 2-dehydrogenase